MTGKTETSEVEKRKTYVMNLSFVLSSVREMLMDTGTRNEWATNRPVTTDV